MRTKYLPPFATFLNDFFEQRKNTQRAYALNKCRDTFDKINDWEEMLEIHHENSKPLLIKNALSLIRKNYYENKQFNRFYMRNIQDRKKRYP